MRRRHYLVVGLSVLLLASAMGQAAEPLTVTVADPDGAAGRVGPPVAAAIELPKALQALAKAGRLCVGALDASKLALTPAQFEPEAPGASKGTLWWLLHVGSKGEQGFLLTAVSQPVKPMVTARVEEATQRVEVAEGDQPVLRYNFGTVPVPKGVGGRYAVARSDYIHPLYGPAGEVLTKDYSPDHPHHRGLYWAWPEVAWKGEMLDLHALQGVFARPVRLLRTEGGPVCAVVAAESRWMWHDKEPIVAEVATIRAFAASNGGRVIDLEFEFKALVEGVTVHRRGQKAYGGFNLRFSSRQGQQIAHLNAPPDAPERVSWGHIVGVPPEGKEPVGVAILQHQSNPRYPGDWVKYPNLNWLQPTFPASGEKYPLSTTEPLVLRYRLWIHPGTASEDTLVDHWRAYNRLPK